MSRRQTAADRAAKVAAGEMIEARAGQTLRIDRTGARVCISWEELWHSLAVGMYYRAQSAENPKVFYHWEQQTLAAKLHWQAKAKQALRARGYGPGDA